MINYREVIPTAKHIVPYIQSYTYSLGVLHESNAKLITRTLPSVMTQIYFEFVGGLSEIETAGKRFEIAKRTYISCGLGSWMDIYQLKSNQQSRAIKNFKVELYPHALYEIFALSPLEIMNEDLTIADIFGLTTASLLYEEMESSANGEEMIKIFERYFTKIMLERDVEKNSLTTQLLKSSMSIKSLAKETGYSPRWLQKQYRDKFGISYKKIQNNRRFLDTIEGVNQRVLSGKNKINFLDLVYDANYYDQAHFIREFKKNTGMTPSNYLNQKYHDLVNFFW
ncbi:MAG: helix-turn-helix transcriptional regulator [Magnetococcales bacterium]|nr:helix-turn-helix transcriptional regulator [Magnetococcales bacterium]